MHSCTDGIGVFIKTCNTENETRPCICLFTRGYIWRKCTCYPNTPHKNLNLMVVLQTMSVGYLHSCSTPSLSRFLSRSLPLSLTVVMKVLNMTGVMIHKMTGDMGMSLVIFRFLLSLSLCLSVSLSLSLCLSMS